MTRQRIEQLTFVVAAVLALVVYGLTIPEGLPWNGSTPLALAHLGESVSQPAMQHSIWGFYVKVFGGSIALSVSLVALAAGLIGALVCRYFGWRFAACVAIVWIFMPDVWNRAITGQRGVCIAAMWVVAVWVAHALLWRVTKKARMTRKVESDALGGASEAATFAGVQQTAKRGKLNCIAGWVALGVAALFAVASLSLHDYRFGEVASVYARGVVAAAGERVIVLNGVCDEQIGRELKGKNNNKKTISLRNTENNRAKLVAWAKREWPSETNLWLEAEIGPEPFVDAAARAHPDRFYSMMGQSTTPEQWERRWTAVQPYLASRDPFVPVMRRMFAYEGNAVGNGLQEKGELKAAWNLYYRVFTEVDAHNPAACVNLNEMLRRGYKVDELTRQRIESAQADYVKLLKDKEQAVQVAERIAQFGPIMRDQKAYEELCARVRQRMADLEKAGKAHMCVPDLKTLDEWHLDMLKAFDAGKYDRAAHIARSILARKAWRNYVPAYAVLGEMMVMKEDWVAAESFLRVAANATGMAEPMPAVMNDYAESLRQLGRMDEAEKFARKAVKKVTEIADEKTGWMCRLTLVQVLAAKKNDNLAVRQEIKSLLKAILTQAPREQRDKIRNEYKEYLR